MTAACIVARDTKRKNFGLYNWEYNVKVAAQSYQTSAMADVQDLSRSKGTQRHLRYSQPGYRAGRHGSDLLLASWLPSRSPSFEHNGEGGSALMQRISILPEEKGSPVDYI
jgi:hypothetical protein